MDAVRLVLVHEIKFNDLSKAFAADCARRVTTAARDEVQPCKVVKVDKPFRIKVPLRYTQSVLRPQPQQRIVANLPVLHESVSDVFRTRFCEWMVFSQKNEKLPYFGVFVHRHPSGKVTRQSTSLLLG